MIFLAQVLLISILGFSDVNYLSSEGQITAAQGDCTEIHEILKDLQSFSKKTVGTQLCQPKDISTKNGECHLELQKCLPNYMKKWIDESPSKSGTNCYGTAFYATQNNPLLRFVSEAEFSSWVKYGYCSPTQNPEPGSIGAFYSPQEFIHAFTYLSSNLVYEKMGFDLPNDKYPVLLNSFFNSKFKWEADPLCRRYDDGKKECYNKIRFFNCDIREFYTNLEKNLLARLTELDRIVENIVLYSFTSALEVEQAQEIIREIEVDLDNMNPISPTYQILQEVLNSIKDQIK